MHPSANLYPRSAYSQGTVLPTANTSKNPDPTKFTEYLSWTSVPNFVDLHGFTNNLVLGTTQFLSPPTDPETPIYSIKARSATRAKPDIELHLGSDLGSPLAAVGRLHVKTHNFGIADVSNDGIEGLEVDRVLTKDGIGEEFMTWENLKQVTKWTDRIHEFQWGVGRERKTYTWLRTKESWPNSMREMELRVGNRAEAEGGGECLARWVRTDAVSTAKRGNLYIKRREGNNEEDKRWESVVLITFLLILDMAIKKG